ncbi:hypothetical protein SDRG_02819 [Saprolegnia diclina VS20]|uniref:Glucosidase II beta subunit N-terminal domain-containing protein n=1 Tax=Saprolegnia diclina (strain VS20) TaxID=1156394 RepID=T0R1G9_SAPDV|nr:hypothetical protein SDRG_02819 [Saprolegnia diclina VS20]EQC40170.1 hypothetical protein SDRG_02819 [Saprolegnia diclina VS20]|eukprot:XP_008606644.1 hypothetical protein SDRG_02819 [Saprolegnia diclina VS20]
MDSNARFRRRVADDEEAGVAVSPRSAMRNSAPRFAWKLPLCLLLLGCLLVWSLSAGGEHPSSEPQLRKVMAPHTTLRFCGVQKKMVLRDDQINDDYCDCLEDGLDEAGTSACSHIVPVVEFTCKDAAKIPTTVVHDGVCDCSLCEDEA